MAIDPDDNISLETVISICQTIKNKQIEVVNDQFRKSKTIDFMAKYEYTDDDVRDVIHGLTKQDYHSGPLPDINPNYKHPFWVFVKHIDDISIKVYIKIKLINKLKKLIVFSIHEEGLIE